MISTLDVIIPVKFPSTHLENMRKILNEVPREIKVKYVLDCETDFLIDMKNMSIKVHERIVTGRFGSPGFARNSGFKEGNSEYVIFWDVDDEPNLIPTLNLLNKIVTNNADVGIGNWTFSHSKNKPKGISPFSVGSSPGIWRCIFRREFIKEMTFSPYKWGEDQLFIAEVLAMEPKIVTSEEIIYSYRISSQGSLTSNQSLVTELPNSLARLINLANYSLGKIGFILEIMIIRQILTIFKYGGLKLGVAALHNLFKKQSKKVIWRNLIQALKRNTWSWI